MRMLLRGLLIVVALVVFGVLALGSWTWARSEAQLHSYERPPAFNMPIPTDADAIARGKHLVDTRGCRGCHGEQLEGEVMWGYAVAPGLAKLAREVTAADIEAAVRHGIDHTGRAMYSMPAFSFIRLSDADMADLIAYLRTAPVIEKEFPDASLPWKIRWEIARGRDFPIPGFLDKVPALAPGGGDTPQALGEYIAMTTCIECHGFRLRGDELFGGPAPDLAIVAAYDQAAFTKLMRTGKALGERELPMMSPAARGRFVHFSDEEVQSLLLFLKQLSQTNPQDGHQEN